MEGVPLKSRAVVFAGAAGAVSFVLALLATFHGSPDAEQLAAPVIAAIVCGTLAWASVQRGLAGVATAIDAASARIADAAAGDLTSPTPKTVRDELPVLSRALDTLFDQVRGTLDTAQTIAMFDPVTSLPNRTYFRQEVERSLAARTAADVAGAAPAMLAFIDLDRFKSVNDTLGHAYGDQLLAKVGQRLRDVAVRAAKRGHADIVAGRLSGDEFTLFLPAIGSRDKAEALARVLLADLIRPYDLGGQSVTIGASIGLALHPEHGETLTPLMRAADVAMYHAKAAGRGRVRFYDGAVASRLTQRATVEAELRQAVAREEFRFLYQPQAVLADGRIDVVEALLCWEHPAGEFRTLDSFAGIAENSGLMLDIGNWAIERLAEQLAGRPLASRLAVPVGKQQIIQHGFFDRVRAALATRGVALSLLEFQIAEAVATACSPVVVDQLRRLRDDGAHVTIDAFGAGASHLARLRALPVDRIKLAPGLVAAIEHDAAARDVAQALIALVHGLGATAVAAGVATAGQLAMLRVMGCDAAQGDAVAPAMTEAGYILWNASDRIRA